MEDYRGEPYEGHRYWVKNRHAVLSAKSDEDMKAHFDKEIALRRILDDIDGDALIAVTEMLDGELEKRRKKNDTRSHK